jgi:hypothetical protein
MLQPNSSARPVWYAGWIDGRNCIIGIATGGHQTPRSCASAQNRTKAGKEFQVKTSNSSKNEFGLGAFNICFSAVKEQRGVLGVALTNRESFTSSATMKDVETAVEKVFNNLVQTNGMKHHLKGRRIMFGVIKKVHIVSFMQRTNVSI